MFRIWLISLNRRQDRRCRTLRLLRGMACEVTIVDSYHGMTTDGQALSRRLLEAQGVSVFPWKIAGSSNAWWARDLKYGEIGCALAHLAAWEQIATCNAPGLVLEDDVHFTSMFWARLRARIEVLQEFDVTPDLMYLGRDAAGSAPEPVVAHILTAPTAICFGLAAPACSPWLVLTRQWCQPTSFLAACIPGIRGRTSHTASLHSSMQLRAHLPFWLNSPVVW